MNKWKWGAIAAVIIAMFFLGRCNGIQSVIKRTGSDTTVRKDSIQLAYVPVPVLVKYDSLLYKDKLVKVQVYDTLWGTPEVVIEPVDSAEILKDYYAARIYSDTQRLKRGQVIINDTVSRNRITGRGLNVTGADTVIKNTVVFYPPKKAVGYFTLSGMGNAKTPGAGIGAGFGLKLPNDRIYQVEYKLMTGNRPALEARIFFPIRLLKRK